MTDKRKNLPKTSTKREIDAFVQKVRSTPAIKSSADRGRLIFAMDATASREPMWDRACQIQGEMFSETAALGGLAIQLCYYRGYGEFNASPWISTADILLKRMTSVSCRGGFTQIEKVLRQTIKETKQKKVQALVFVGDCVEEDTDRLCHLAGELGLHGVPIFIFHEGSDSKAEKAFRQMTELTRGAYCPFDTTSAGQLRDLLSAVAVYAAGGQAALQDFSKQSSEAVKKLTHQLSKD